MEPDRLEDNFIYQVLRSSVGDALLQLLVDYPDVSLGDHLQTSLFPPHIMTALTIAQKMRDTGCDSIAAMKALDMDLIDPITVHIGCAVEYIANTYPFSFFS